MASSANAALKSISPPDTQPVRSRSDHLAASCRGARYPSITRLAVGNRRLTREGVRADDECARYGWSADRACQAISPGLATTRMAARPSDVLQRTAAAPLTKWLPVYALSGGHPRTGNGLRTPSAVNRPIVPIRAQFPCRNNVSRAGDRCLRRFGPRAHHHGGRRNGMRSYGNASRFTAIRKV